MENCPEELLAYLPRILVCRCYDIFRECFAMNSLLQNYFQGEAVNFGTEEKQHILKITAEYWVSCYNSAVSNKNWLFVDYLRISCIEAMTDQQMLDSILELTPINQLKDGKQACGYKNALHRAIKNKITSLKGENIPKTGESDADRKRQLTEWLDVKKIEENRRVLETYNQNKPAIKNPLSSSRLRAEPSEKQKSTASAKKRDENQSRPITQNDIDNVINFLSNEKSSSADINKLWQENRLFRDYLAGKEITLGKEENSAKRTITPEEWLNCFSKALSDKCEVSENIWDAANSLMRAYFVGKEIEFNGKTLKITEEEKAKNMTAVATSGNKDLALKVLCAAQSVEVKTHPPDELTNSPIDSQQPLDNEPTVPESKSNTVLLTKEKIEGLMGYIGNRQQGAIEATLKSNPALKIILQENK